MKIGNIKFKAKRLDNGEWVEGDLVRSITPIRICTPHSIFPDIPIVHRVDPDTVCMFTGLKDCKGNEIWEHDLLQSRETRAIYEVVWDENGGFIIKNSVGGGHLLNFLGSILSVFNFKVVGNKYTR